MFWLIGSDSSFPKFRHCEAKNDYNTYFSFCQNQVRIYVNIIVVRKYELPIIWLSLLSLV